VPSIMPLFIHFQIRKASHYPLDSAHSTGYEYAVFVL
jgi:hypothetical protein